MDRDIAMVFQNYALYPHMSVAGNMAFGLKMRKFEKSEIESRIKRAADILGIGDLLHRKAAPALGRAAPEGRPGPRHRARSQGVSCSTSRSAISTPSSGCRCGSSSRSCTSGWAPRRST